MGDTAPKLPERRPAARSHDPWTQPQHHLQRDQETACRDYCTSKDLSVTTIFTDEPGAGDQFDEMITGPEAPFDAIVVWKLNRFSTSLEETIAYRDQLRQTRTKLLSATERGIDD